MQSHWIPSTNIAEFHLERRLGHGATSEVWLARDTLLERDVALKIATSVPSAQMRIRFRIEARVVARMQHPNLLVIHHVGEVEDRPFLVTEFLSGSPLDALERPVSPPRVVSIGIDLARGLAAAHDAGVLHRDIKPANAFLCDDGVAKLIDFGLARLSESPSVLAETMSSGRGPGVSPGELDVTVPEFTESHRLAGTPLYMAPETWREEIATRDADVYSLGALLFELLTGRPPIMTGSLSELHRRVVTGDVDDLAVLAPTTPAPLAALVHRCLRLDASERPTANEVCDALARMSPPRRSEGAETPVESGENPYRGLLSFGPEHRALFFGRDAEVAAVIAELRASPFVLVAGTSGAGKSSLVRAGVAPRVEKGVLGRAFPWRTIVIVPGRRPIEALARAMGPVLGVSEEEAAGGLAKSPAWLADAARAAQARVLLVIDQLEEIWTLAAAADRRAFFEILAAVARSAPTVRTVATLRVDFLGRLEDMGELQALALRALVVLRPMTQGGLRSAIAEPALSRGVTIEPALVEHLVARSRTEAGSLPLLEFALSALYVRRGEGRTTIGLADLDALGGVEGALAMHADATLAKLPPKQRREARRLLLALVTVERTRARRGESDLLGPAAEDARPALDALVDARLVVAGAGERGAVYEVAHEALLSGWPALCAWLEEEAATREVADRVRRAAAEWERVGRAREALFGERQLRELDAHGELLDAAGGAFVMASRAAVKRAQARRWALVFGVPLLIGSLGLAGWALSFARHRAAVARAVAAARALDAKAEETARAASDARTAAIALFEKNDLGPAEERWKKALGLEEETDRERREVGAELDGALALDPRDPRARALYADVTLARVLAAERLHEDASLRELRARLDVYDDGSRAASLRVLAHVRTSSEPPGAVLTLARYREDAAGRLIETDRAPLATGVSIPLEAGSYLIVAEAPDRYTTRYPFLVRRGEELALRVVLPRVTDVPEGMVYVPAGRSLYGSSDGEATREVLAHQPAHDIDVGAFLIARLEVTNGDYVAFLLSLPEPDRKARLSPWLTLPSEVRAVWKFHGRSFPWGESYCDGVQPCVDWTRLPIDGASREDGERFAEWLARSGRLPGARLCTDQEWERAARGADDRRYPNGNGEVQPGDACSLATFGGDIRRAGPCLGGTHPATRSLFGVDDLTGGEWEWTSGSPDIARPKQGTRRGSAWAEGGMELQISNRAPTSARARLFSYGLRVCADAR